MLASTMEFSTYGRYSPTHPNMSSEWQESEETATGRTLFPGPPAADPSGPNSVHAPVLDDNPTFQTPEGVVLVQLPVFRRHIINVPPLS